MPEKRNTKKSIRDNPVLLAEWDWEKNVFSPDSVSYGSAKICYWICSKCGHHWKTPAYSRGSNGCGCPDCAKKNHGATKKKNAAIKNSFIKNYPLIAKEWHFSKNVDFDINNVSAFSNIKVWWLCSKCGNEWETTVCHRTKDGTGCPVCSKEKGAATKVKTHANNNNFAENFPQTAEEWHPTKNGSLTANDVSASSNKRVWWKCSFCGNEWQTSVNHRTSGQSCPACNRYQTSFPEQALFFYISALFPDAVNRKKISGFEFDVYIPSINVAIEYDGIRYHNSLNVLEKDNKKDTFCKKRGITLFRFRDISLPDTDYAIRITCNDNTVGHGIAKLIKAIYKDKTIDIDLQRDRYKIIKRLRQDMLANSIVALKPKFSSEWNYRLNGHLRPESVAANAGYKVWWKCPDCGYEWQSTPNHRFNGRGCPACAGNICVPGKNDLLSQNPTVAQEWCYEKNFPLTPDNIAIKSNKKVWWRCSNGHEWEAVVSERNRGTRSTHCPYCCNKKILIGYNDLATTHPELAREWHPTKNGALSPQMISAGSSKKVWWLCEKGHEWETFVYSRKSGRGCPICYKENR